MREIDKRTRVGRRRFLHGSATAVPAAMAAAVGAAVTSRAAWAQAAKNLRPHAMATLVQLARDTYPHDMLADRYYIAAVAGYDSADAKVRALVDEGVDALDAAAKRNFGKTYLEVPWEEDRVALVRASENTPLIKKLRGDLLATLYNQKAVWPKFGYEGSSFDKGGYINRGFSDIDWVP